MAVDTHTHPYQKTWELTPEGVVQDGLRRLRGMGAGHRLALIITAVLGVIGLVALIAGPILSGFGDRQAWAYVGATLGFLMSTVASAPCITAALRLARGQWRRPVNRVAELWGAALIIPAILFFLLLATLPGTEGRMSIWGGWPGSPWLWDAILMIVLAVSGYALLYTSSIPDFAVARDHLEGENGGRFTRLARGWYGTERQWRVLDRGVSYLGAFYVIAYVGTMTLIASDLILSMIPGYFSAIFPASYTIAGFEGGVALTILTSVILRRWGGAAEYLDKDQFFGLAKLLLALGLLWFYFWWSEFILFWYARTPREVNLMDYLYFGTYRWPFIIAFALNFLAPLLILMWTRSRQSIVGPTVTAILVLIGNLVNQVRLYAAGFATEDLTLHDVGDPAPAALTPGILDILIVVGLAGGAAALVLFALRRVAYPSIWEMIPGLLLRVGRPFHHAHTVVVGKPE